LISKIQKRRIFIIKTWFFKISLLNFSFYYDLMKKNLIFLLLISLSLSKIIAQGQLIDSITKSPIPYAIVSVNTKELGTYSDEEGYFELKGLSNNDTLVFKHIGYKGKIISYKLLIYNKIVELSPRYYDIKEVIITNKKLKDLEIGFTRLKANSTLGVVDYGAEHATLIKDPLYEGKKIKAIAYKIKKDKNINSLVRVHLYSNHKGKPGEELLIKNNIVIIDKYTGNRIVFDIGQYNLKFPNDGIFISLECIGVLNNENKLEKHPKRISPGSEIKYVKKDGTPKYYFRQWGGEWNQPGGYKDYDFQPLFGLILQP